MPPPDFSFLSDELRRQRELAQEALDEAKRIDKILAGIDEPKVKEALTMTKETLLNLASGLAANATSTSSAATITLSGVGIK